MMYKLIVESKIGDYLKDKSGAIYKVTGISVNIVFNQDTMEEEARLLFEGVDARDPFGQFYIIGGHLVSKATKEEVDYYILGPQANKDMNKIMSSLAPTDHQALSNKGPEQSVEKREKVRTVDDVLDDTIYTKHLIELFGDEDGKYEGKLTELSEEFKQFSK